MLVILKVLLWSSVTGNVAISPAWTKHDETVKLESTNITRETKEIRLETTEVLRAEHTHF